ncbi:MAG: MotA/TolQ/ExbB proton channel family protein [Opitutae bacterium]|nr:MotA/TolQ/ExbB proton channel family protein [Opitutae bacterium]
MFFDLLRGAGFLIYPLGICSFIAVFIVAERAYGLRKDAVLPDDLVDAILEGKPVQSGRHSVMARIVAYAETHRNDPDAIKAFARLEINRMERGIPYLDVIYITSPLLGLTGTVWGLINVFRSVGPAGVPEPAPFMQGVTFALSATLFGLIIAMIAFVPGGFLQRKVENYAVKIDLLLERLLTQKTVETK